MPIHHRLLRLGMTPDSVRQALSNYGVTVQPPAPDGLAKTDQHLKTEYLDGEGQRHRKRVMKTNEAFIIGRLLRGTSVRKLATACMVTDVAIYNRGEQFGVNWRRPADTRASGCAVRMLGR